VITVRLRIESKHASPDLATLSNCLCDRPAPCDVVTAVHAAEPTRPDTWEFRLKTQWNDNPELKSPTLYCADTRLAHWDCVRPAESGTKLHSRGTQHFATPARAPPSGTKQGPKANGEARGRGRVAGRQQGQRGQGPVSRTADVKVSIERPGNNRTRHSPRSRGFGAPSSWVKLRHCDLSSHSPERCWYQPAHHLVAPSPPEWTHSRK